MIAKKLAGKAAQTAAWCTNISNEHGQEVQSVMTAAEGYLVDDMIRGVTKRYHDAEVSPPVLLYVDAHVVAAPLLSTRSKKHGQSCA